MNIDKKTEYFVRLGELLRKMGMTGSCDVLSDHGANAGGFASAVKKAREGNPWFTAGAIYHMLEATGKSLSHADLERWTGMYKAGEPRKRATVAVIMAGNIPAVGFHDLLCVLMSGHRAMVKLSGDDRHLLPAIAGLLIDMDPDFEQFIQFTDEVMRGFDAVIATGSNNTSRYFNYYFGKYPHIIRKNRNALAVLNGEETDEELEALGADIFTYFGLGCRNVSKLMVPEDYDFPAFFDAIKGYAGVGQHHKYMNNYDYNKSICLVNGEPHFDNGFLLLKEDGSMASPVSVLHYERYRDIAAVNDHIRDESENIQCVVSADPTIKGSIPPGTTQQPRLWDYADGVDTMAFLLGL